MWLGHLLVPYSLPRFTTVVCHICGRDYFLPFLLFIRNFLFPNSMVPRQKGCLNICSSYIHFDWLLRSGTYSVRHPLGMSLLDASNTSYICIPI